MDHWPVGLVCVKMYDNIASATHGNILRFCGTACEVATVIWARRRGFRQRRRLIVMVAAWKRQPLCIVQNGTGIRFCVDDVDEGNSVAAQTVFLCVSTKCLEVSSVEI